MTSAETSKRGSRIHWVTIAIAMLSLLVAFTGIKFQDISTYISSSLYPRADYTIESVKTPEYLSGDVRLSLSVPDEYFIVTSVSLKSDTPYQGDPLQFSISFENRGKKSCEQPNIIIYFVDYLYRVWGVWNKSATNDDLTKGYTIEYHFPPLDQKLIGSWAAFVLLYDYKGAMPLLVSYALRTFWVTDVPPRPWWEDVVTFVAGMAILSAFIFVAIRILDYYERKKKLKKATRSEKKDLSTNKYADLST